MVFEATILHWKTLLGTTWANEMNVLMNHAPDAGSIYNWITKEIKQVVAPKG